VEEEGGGALPGAPRGRLPGVVTAAEALPLDPELLPSAAAPPPHDRGHLELAV
jgi:hypothetical protein